MFEKIIKEINAKILNNECSPHTVRERRQYLFSCVEEISAEDRNRMYERMALMTDCEVMGRDK